MSDNRKKLRGIFSDFFSSELQSSTNQAIANASKELDKELAVLVERISKSQIGAGGRSGPSQKKQTPSLDREPSSEDNAFANKVTQTQSSALSAPTLDTIENQQISDKKETGDSASFTKAVSLRFVKAIQVIRSLSNSIWRR